MTLESGLSIAMLGSFIWAVRFLIPKAVNEHDILAVTCAVTAVLALLTWLLIGVGTRSVTF